jgi:hypothetical protein
MSPLRRRMIEDMAVRNFATDTQRNYLGAVKNLAIFLGRSPDTATAEDLRLFQLHLSETNARPPTINGTVTALRFFFSVTVDRSAVTKPLTFVAEPQSRDGDKRHLIITRISRPNDLPDNDLPKFHAGRVDDNGDLSVGAADLLRYGFAITRIQQRREQLAVVSGRDAPYGGTHSGLSTAARQTSQRIARDRIDRIRGGAGTAYRKRWRAGLRRGRRIKPAISCGMRQFSISFGIWRHP